MGPLGMQELIVIFVIALLVFGPRKLPELGQSLGKGLREFKRATNEMKATWDEQLKDVTSEIRDTERDLRKVERDFKKDLDADEAPPVPKPSAAPVDTAGQGTIQSPADTGGEPGEGPVTTETAEAPDSATDSGNSPSGTPS